MAHVKHSVGKFAQTGRALTRASLLIGTALTGMTGLSAGSAWAACSGGIGVNVNATCDTPPNDTNGFVVLAGNNATVTFTPNATLSNNLTALSVTALGSFNMTVGSTNSITGGIGGGLNLGYGVLSTAGSGGTVVTNGNVTGDLGGLQMSFGAGTVNYTNTALVTGGAGDGVEIIRTGAGATTVINSGTIVAGDDGVVITRTAGSGAGDVTVTNNNLIGASALSRVGGDGIDVNQNASGTVIVNNNAGGSIFAAANGIDVNSASGTVTVTNRGTVNATGVGVNAYSATGSVTVSNFSNNSIVSGGDGLVAVGGGNVIAQNGDFVGTNPDGLINAGGRGVVAATSGVASTVLVELGSNSSITSVGNGVYATTSDPLLGGVVTNQGLITVNAALGAQVTSSTASGIVAVGGNSSIVVQSGANINAAADGVNASTTGFGSVNITTTAGSTIAAGGNGVIGQTSGNVGTVTINNQANIGTVGTPVGGNGVVGLVTNAGNSTPLNVSNAGAVFAANNGIVAVTDGTGNVTASTTGAVVGGQSGMVATIKNSASNGSLLVSAVNNVTGAALNGINASNAGTGSTTVNTAPTTTVTGGVDGIVAQNTNAATVANVTVNAQGSVTGGTNGIAATHAGASGLVSVTTGAGGVVTGTNNVGVFAAATSAASDTNVEVKANGVVVGGATGILATAAGVGNVTVTTAKNVTGGANGGIVASQTGSSGGAVSVTTAANATITATGDGIRATKQGSDGGLVEVKNNSAIVSGSTGIRATSFGADGVVVTNTGNISGAGLQNGIFALALGTDADASVTTSGDIGASGAPAAQAGVFALAADNVTVEQGKGTIYATNVGIAALGGGDVSVKSGAIVTGPGGGFFSGGVLAAGGGAVVVDVNGKITANGNTFGALALSTGGAATVNVNAAIDPPLIGAAAVTFGAGAATVNANAAIDATAVGAVAFNIGSGAVAINSVAGATIKSDGIGALAVNIGDGATTVNIQDTISGSTGAAATDGIVVFNLGGVGDVKVDTAAAATITASNNGISVDKFGGSGAVTVTTLGAIAAGETGISVDRAASDGATAVAVTGNITTTNGDGVNVFSALSAGAITVTTTAATTINAGEDGVQAFMLGGSGAIDITTLGAVTADQNGILVGRIGADGATTVAASGAINATNADGINVGAATSVGDIKVTTSAAATIDAGQDGVQVGMLGGSGAIEITTLARINAAENGILVDRLGANGATTIEARGAITATNADGVNVNSNLSNGAITVTTTSTGTINAGDDGVSVTKLGGTGTIDVTTRAAITAAQNGIVINRVGANDITVDARNAITATAGDGIQVNRALGAGNVSVTYRGLMNAGDDGIEVGQASVGTTTVDTAGRINAADDGINITRLGGSGAVQVNVLGRIAAGDEGVQITRTASAGAIDVDLAAFSRISATNGNGVQVNATASLGNTQVDVGFFSLIDALNGSAISVNTAAIGANSNNDVTINNRGGLIGAGTGALATVAVIADGNVTITNNGLITTATNDPARLAVAVQSGRAIQLTNNFGLNGRVLLGDAGATPTTTRFDNAGFWLTSGASSFRALNDVTLNNTGFVFATGPTWTMASTNGNNYLGNENRMDFRGTSTVAMTSTNGNNTFSNTGVFDTRGDTTFTMTAANGFNLAQNLGTIQVRGSLAYQGGPGLSFENYSLIDMRDGTTNERTSVSGTFTGFAGSTMAIDASLGGPGSQADRLFAGQATAGVTSLVVQDINAGPGGFNPQGIVFAYTPTGNSALGDFVLDPTSSHYDASRGVLDKGLFFYDIATRPGINNPGGVAQVLIGVPDVELFQTPRALTAAQNLWHETAGGWLDRNVDLRRQLMTAYNVVAADPVVRKGYDTPTIIAMGSGAISPGVWAKAVGSWTNRSDRETFSVLNRNYSFNTGYNQDVYGVLAGVDFGTRGMHSPNDALLFGVMAGYVSSKLDFKSTQNGFDMSGATVGLYATYLNQGFFVDVLAKADILDTKWRTPSIAGFGAASTSGDTTSYGVRADTGFRFALNPSVFIEPSATLAYVRTDIDSLTNAGARINFNNGESLRGALGVRLGAEVIKTDDYTMEASITGRIWNEFQGANRVSVVNLGPTLTFDDKIRGAFGEVTGSLNLFSHTTGWSGFLNGGVKFNDDLTTTTVKGGVRYVW